MRVIKNGKAAGPSGMTSDMLKFAGVRELFRVFQGIMGEEHAPDEWPNSLTIPHLQSKRRCTAMWKVQGLEIVGAWHEGLGKSTK